MKKSSIFGKVLSVFVFFVPFAFSSEIFYAGVNAKYFYIIFGISFLALIYGYLLWKGDIFLNFKKRYLMFILLFLISLLYIASIFGVFPERSFYSEILRSSGTVFLTYIILLTFICGETLNKTDWKIVRLSISFFF